MRKFAGLAVYAWMTIGAATLLGAPDQSEAAIQAAARADEVRLLPADLPDEVAMMLAGSALLGLAAAVRRAA